MSVLYLLTPSPIPDEAWFWQQIKSILSANAVAMLQLRLKDHPRSYVERILSRMQPACRRAGVPLVLNDDPYLACQYECDGVHIGKEDGCIREARRVLGRKRLLGVSCYGSLARAHAAAACGADYVAFGSFFKSLSKPQTEARARPSHHLLSLWRARSHPRSHHCPAVAIGGITKRRMNGLLQAGADYVAVSAAIWQQPSPVDEVIAFHRHSMALLSVRSSNRRSIPKAMPVTGGRSAIALRKLSS